MSEIIASGKIVGTEDLIVAATVSVEAAKEESAEDVYTVYLNVKQYGAETLPADAIAYADIEQMVSEAGAEMVVPGVGGHDDVTLEAPVTVRYAKTKAFEGDNGACVFVTLRYEY